jgi:cation diffusion facilitator CzcD-associated flavoprotein CzcO
MPAFSRLAVAVQLISIIFTPALAASTPKDYDYVIVGGGVTGLVVANRLTEDKRGEYLMLPARRHADSSNTNGLPQYPSWSLKVAHLSTALET